VADQFDGRENDPEVRMGNARDWSRSIRCLNNVVSIMARDPVDVWCEQRPSVSDRKAMQRWLDAMPEVSPSSIAPARSDDLIFKTIENPPPVKEVDPVIDDGLGAPETPIEALADEIGAMVGRLERRVREIEVQLSYEQRIRGLEVQFKEQRIHELESKLNKLSADMDAGHARTAAPLIPLKGGRDAA
jgi:hypothetical protein